ncbi:MAG: histidine triad family protein [Patescibacteria group bacterium]|jgi:histidine triad (HIT) family protein|nr:histidine triad family protein [Patescibacteria group bacterium]
MNCIFCQIVERDAPATIVFENEAVLGILPIEPITEGHTLIIPKKHSTNVLDMDQADLIEVTKISQELGRQILVQQNASGLNLLHAAGEDAQQSVFHTHFHLVPRNSGDGLDLWFRNKL